MSVFQTHSVGGIYIYIYMTQRQYKKIHKGTDWVVANCLLKGEEMFKYSCFVLEHFKAFNKNPSIEKPILPRLVLNLWS